ncbi:OTU domain [Mactra antiquata]
MAEEFVFDPNKNYDDATMAQLQKMEKEIAENQKLISDRVSFDSLSEEYAKEDEIYRTKIQQDLKNRYKCVRKTRGDGNCFFRAFGFACLENLSNDKSQLQRFLEVAKQSKSELVSLGFPEFTIEDFHETFMDVLTKVENDCTLEELLETFNDQGLSDYIVVYLRLIVSGYLQKESDFYSSFLEGDRTMKEFCNQEVEPMGKESDHIHIIALTSSLGVPVRVEYLDRAGTSTCNHHDFPEDSTPVITLLYRPGHYDILYS